jgi:hypothetical protein
MNQNKYLIKKELFSLILLGSLSFSVWYSKKGKRGINLNFKRSKNTKSTKIKNINPFYLSCCKDIVV